MQPDLFERFKYNDSLTPISANTLRKIGKHAGLSADSVVFDAHCGKGGSVIALARMFGCSAIGLDDRPEFVEDGKRRVLFEDLSHLIDLLTYPEGELPFDDDYFDLALLCGPAHPSGIVDGLEGLARIVKPGGWVACSGLVWKSEDENLPPGELAGWLESYLPCEPDDVEERWSGFMEGRYHVEFVERETQSAWESFLVPQARSILENRHEYAGSREAQEVLDNWQRDLEAYHGGGKHFLDYATFLLRCP